MPASGEAEVQQHGLSVVAGGVLVDVHVGLGPGAAGGEVELHGLVPQRPEEGLGLPAPVLVHELPGEVVGLADALVDGPQPFVVGFGVLVALLHLVSEEVEFINGNLVGADGLLNSAGVGAGVVGNWQERLGTASNRQELAGAAVIGAGRVKQQ